MSSFPKKQAKSGSLATTTGRTECILLHLENDQLVYLPGDSLVEVVEGKLVDLGVSYDQSPHPFHFRLRAPLELKSGVALPKGTILLSTGVSTCDEISMIANGRREDGTHWIPKRTIVEAIGLYSSAHSRLIEESAVNNN